MQIGPVRYRFSAKDKVKLQGIAHYVYPRFTRLINTTGQDWKINEAYATVHGSDVRNRQIISDIEECLRQGRTPLVLTKFRDHADILLAMLRDKADHVFLLKGGRSRKENEQIRENMKNVPANESMVLVAIGQYIGEGFNYPRLDTMMLTTPIAWQGNVEQYSGRLHRDYEGKRKVIIYDYVDAHIRVLDKMYYYSGICTEHLYQIPEGDYAVFTACIRDEETDFSPLFDWMEENGFQSDFIIAEELGFQLFKYIHEYYCEIRAYLKKTPI